MEGINGKNEMEGGGAMASKTKRNSGAFRRVKVKAEDNGTRNVYYDGWYVRCADAIEGGIQSRHC